MRKSNIRWKRVFRLTIAALLAVALLAPLFYAVSWAYNSVRPAHSIVPAADFDFPYETIHFPSRDGLDLVGWYVAPQNGIVILLTHGYDGNRSQLAFHVSTLVHAGYGVLAYDMRGHGESAGETRTFGWREIDDLLGALDYAQAQENVEHIGTFGFSVGGQVTLRTAAQSADIEAVVADGASIAIFTDNPTPVNISDWLFMPVSWWFTNFIGWFSGTPQPVGVIESLPQIAPRPILLIATSNNRELRQSTRYCETAGANCTLWNIPETGHGGGSSARPEEYAQHLVSFFNTAFNIDN